MNWRRTVYQYTTSFETPRRANMEDKRKRRVPCEINIEQIVTCNSCGKTCLSRIGFIGHQCTCSRRGLPLPESSFAKQSDDDGDDDDIKFALLLWYIISNILNTLTLPLFGPCYWNHPVVILLSFLLPLILHHSRHQTYSSHQSGSLQTVHWYFT